MTTSNEMPPPRTGCCSIIMPCFGMGQYVGAALESVGAQTYTNWELIVVDDCGPEDGTRETVEAFARRHTNNRVEFVRHDVNKGVSAARRTAFDQAQGEYIAFLDPDDMYLPEKLSAHIAALEARPSAVLAHGRIVAVNDDENVRRKTETDFSLGDKAFQYELYGQPYCFFGNPINNSTVVCRRRAISPDDFPLDLIFQIEDWFLWLMVARAGEFYYDPTPYTQYRCHPGSFSSRIYSRPGGPSLAYLEVLATLFPTAPRSQKVLLAESMLLHMDLLIGSRGRTRGRPNGKSKIRSSLFYVLARQGLRHLRNPIGWVKRFAILSRSVTNLASEP